MNTFQKIFTNHLNPEVLVQEEANREQELIKQDQDYITNVVNSMNYANTAEDFGSANINVLAALHRDPNLINIKQINDNISSLIDEITNAVNAAFDSVTKKESIDYLPQAVAPSLTNNEPSKEETIKADDKNKEPSEEESKPQAIKADNENKESLNRLTNIYDKIINDENIRTFISICKKYSRPQEINSGMSNLTNILALTKDNTYNLSKTQLSIIEQYKSNLMSFSRKEDKNATQQLNNIFNSVENSLKQYEANKGVKKESNTFKKYLIDKYVFEKTEEPSLVRTAITRLLVWRHKLGKLYDEYMTGVSAMYKFIFGFVIFFIIPRLIDFAINNAGTIISKWVFPLGAFTSASRIIVVGGEGINPQEAVDTAITKITDIIISPIKNLWNTIKNTFIGKALLLR